MIRLDYPFHCFASFYCCQLLHFTHKKNIHFSHLKFPEPKSGQKESIIYYYNSVWLSFSDHRYISSSYSHLSQTASKSDKFCHQIRKRNRQTFVWRPWISYIQGLYSAFGVHLNLLELAKPLRLRMSHRS